MKPETMKEKGIALKLLTEQSLHQTIIPGLVSYCPSMDLIALGTIDNQVQIFRLNGQEVYKSNQRKSDIKVQSLAWKPNGMFSPSPRVNVLLITRTRPTSCHRLE